MAFKAKRNTLRKRCYGGFTPLEDRTEKAAVKSDKTVARGFTLIELLVVIAIISVLVAILIPAMHMVRVTAWRVICRSNLKQIALAWQMYLDENEGKFYGGDNADVDYGGWKGPEVVLDPNKGRVLNKHVRLAPILETEREGTVFKCPADDSISYGSYDSTYQGYGTSYRTNHLLIGPARLYWFPNKTLKKELNKRMKHRNRSNVANPSRLLLIGDYGWVDQWWPDPGDPWGLRLEWHRKCCHHNLAFLDGHVEFLKIQKGVYVTAHYSVLPFGELFDLGLEVQEQVPCPLCD
jgi:prepilin-type N-terminal cleavage/methylation domain-containing protein/prepilin-type processing-associated H-X9-DG protein